MDATSSGSLMEMSREHDARLQKIRDANHDLRERLIAEGVTIS